MIIGELPVLPETIPALLAALQEHPDVIGLLRFGSQPEPNQPIAGDYDLFVVLTSADPHVRSVHFCLDQMPIDLNLISLDELERITPADHFRSRAFCEGTVLYDPHGFVTQVQAQLQEQLRHQAAALSEHTIATTRHWHRHMLDKVRNRLDTMPTFCRYALHTNCIQLVRTYFRIYGLPYPGETRAFGYLRTHEPTVFNLLKAYLDSQALPEQLDLLTALAEHILAPIGGLWQHDEVLAFGTEASDNLQARGIDVLMQLFSQPSAPK